MIVERYTSFGGLFNFSEALNSKELISLFMFEENGRPVGFANLMTIFSVWSHGKALILDDLYIVPEERGKGYGKKALQFIEEFANERQYKRLQFQSEFVERYTSFGGLFNRVW